MHIRRAYALQFRAARPNTYEIRGGLHLPVFTEFSQSHKKRPLRNVKGEDSAVPPHFIHFLNSEPIAPGRKYTSEVL